MADYQRNHALIHARIKCGYTQEVAAQLAGVSLKTWQAWEQGYRAPTGRHLDIVAHVLNTTPAQLRSIPTPQPDLFGAQYYD